MALEVSLSLALALSLSLAGTMYQRVLAIASSKSESEPPPREFQWPEPGTCVQAHHWSFKQILLEVSDGLLEMNQASKSSLRRSHQQIRWYSPTFVSYPAGSHESS